MMKLSVSSASMIKQENYRKKTISRWLKRSRYAQFLRHVALAIVEAVILVNGGTGKMAQIG